MIDEFLQREIDVGSFPSAVYAVGSSSGIEREGALGHAVAVPLHIPATLDTIYEARSLLTHGSRLLEYDLPSAFALSET